MGYLIGPSGGLAYHMAAWLGRKRRWRPFIGAVDRWLRDRWNPTERELIIFGPSAGWTMSETFLERFDSVLCVEPDPVARWLFRRRFGSVTRIRFISRTDLLPWFAPPESSAFVGFLNEHPRHAILFSNLLGQIPHLRAQSQPRIEAETEAPEPLSEAAFREDFLSALKGRSWASYHDILSGDRPPLGTPEPFIPSRNITLADRLAKIAATVYPPGSNVIDHETLWLSERYETEVALWELRPGRHHLIGFISH